MSWGIQIAGKPDAVIEHIKAQESYGGKDEQFDAAKEFILREVAAIPDSVKERGMGVRVNAYGHHDQTSRNVTIELQLIAIAQ